MSQGIDLQKVKPTVFLNIDLPDHVGLTERAALSGIRISGAVFRAEEFESSRPCESELSSVTYMKLSFEVYGHSGTKCRGPMQSVSLEG